MKKLALLLILFPLFLTSCNKNKDDDFIPLMRNITSQYRRIIFATPVYWYSMSAIMKTFFDRISDLLTWEKELGRTLRGKEVGVVSCSGHNDLREGFDMPFKESAHYLGMEYLGHVHTWAGSKGMEIAAQVRLSKFLNMDVVWETELKGQTS